LRRINCTPRAACRYCGLINSAGNEITKSAHSLARLIAAAIGRSRQVRCEGIGMTMQFLAGSALVLAIGCGAVLAQNPDERTWRFRTESGESFLSYGTDNDEDTPISFSCKAKAGIVTMFINETGVGVKAGRAMTASLTAGTVTATTRGRTLTNEEAGTPSFQGTLPAADPLFAALAKAKSLVMVVAPSRQDVPLAKLGDKADKFAEKCRKG
jgi:hypothetical protein